jgi:LPXTG-motif cell wall-anchored protein
MRSMFRAALVAFGLALLPALAGAAPPAPKGQVVYEDDFTDAAASSFEDNLRASDYGRGFHPPGVYHLKIVNPNAVGAALLPTHSYGQFSVEVEVSDNSDVIQGASSQGVVFRAQDQTHYYAVLVNSRDGQYAIRKLNGRQWTDIVAMTDSALVKPDTEVNLLRVDGEGDDFTVYLNGETLDSFSDASYAKGTVGMILANVDAVEPHMHFDNMAVYSTEPAPEAPAVPATLPNTGAAESAPALALAALALMLLALGAMARRAGS